MNAASPRPRTDPSFWDKIAQKYSQKPVDDPEAFERKIAITKRLLRPDSRVLDVGCGTGLLADCLRGEGFQYFHGAPCGRPVAGAVREVGSP